MYTTGALLDLHARSHQALKKLVEHCRELSPEELNREMPGFAYPSVRLQLHHMIGAEEYWVSVLNGKIHIEEDEGFATAESLEQYRQKVSATTETYLRAASEEELNTPRAMMTWGDVEKTLVPARVFLRTQTHLFSHSGQVMAMCKLIGKPGAGMDFPIA